MGRTVLAAATFVVACVLAPTALQPQETVTVSPSFGIAASDDHRSQPGKPHWGLAAVRAPELTRAAIFDGLHARRTYGTTGQRILLDFRVNDAPMGSEIALAAPLPEPCAGTSPECGERAAATAALAPRFEITAHGTDVIETVQILRYSVPDGGFRVIYDLRPNALDFTWSGRDGGFRDDAIYYLRLGQRQSDPRQGRHGLVEPGLG